MVSITFIFVFIISFFLRILFSFIFLIVITNFNLCLSLTKTISCFIILFIFSNYSFLSNFINIGIASLFFFFEYIASCNMNIFCDFISHSSYLVVFVYNNACLNLMFSSFIFCLFYFTIIFLFSFIFFVMRSLFTISYDFVFNNFDSQVSIQNVALTRLKFNNLVILTMSYIYTSEVNHFSYLHYTSILFISCTFLIAIVFAYSMFKTQDCRLFILNMFWNFIINSCTFSIIVNTILVFFKFLFNEIFFLFNFSTIIFITSFFSILIKDFVFISSSMTQICCLTSYDILNFNVFNISCYSLNLCLILTLF